MTREMPTVRLVVDPFSVTDLDDYQNGCAVELTGDAVIYIDDGDGVHVLTVSGPPDHDHVRIVASMVATPSEPSTG